MGLFSRNKDKGGVFKSFERLIKKVWGAKGIARKRDKREAFLTPDLLKQKGSHKGRSSKPCPAIWF